MKNKYFFKTIGFMFTLGLLLLGSYTQAQNRNFLDFDGSNDYVKYTDDATLGRMDGATDYTIEAWIYPVDGRVAEYDRVLQRYYSFAIVMFDGNNDGNVEDWYFQVYDKGSSSWKYYNTEGDATLTLDSWNHIEVINNSSDGSLKLFVNGTDVTTTGGYSNRAMPSSSSSDNLYIGQKGNGASYFGGYIDEIRLKNVAEDPSNLHFHSYDNQYGSDANTAGLFHFNEGSGTTTVNEASSSTASLNNGVAWKAWNLDAAHHLPLAHEWDGTTSDWTTAGNWSGGVPDATTDVLIPLKSTDPTLTTSTTADCRNLLIEGSATLTINSDATGTGSLIIHGSFTNVGSTVAINRYMTAYSTNSDGWRFLSSPVSSFAIAGSGFEPTAGDDDLYEYDETATTDNWLNYTGGTFGDANFVVGKGYLCAYKTTATKQFTGDINTGTVTKNLSYTSGASSPGWNLLGNPYTAAIDWDLLTKSASVDGAVYVVRASDGAYISWNGSTGALTDGIIPAMQGYFVKATAASQSVTMEAADEVHATGTYYKTGNAENTLVVKVAGEKGESNAYIQFREDATKTFDHAIDAYKLFGYSKAPQIYTNDGENMYSINCLPLNVKDYVLPLAVKTNYPGDYKLDFTGIDNLAGNDLKVKLTDLKLNTTVNISEGDTYAYTTSEGDDANRFELEFYSVTGINNASELHQNINIYVSNNGVVIRNMDNKNLNGQVSVLNLLGQVVYTQQLSGSSTQTLHTNLNTGVYIVNLSLDDNSVMSKKLIIR